MNKWVFFDCDGTILDTFKMIEMATKKTFDDGPAQMEGVHYNASLVVDDTSLSEKRLTIRIK